MSFVAFARSHGLVLDYAVADGRIRRVPTESKPRSRNGAYWFDGRRGWVQAWDTSEDVQWFEDPNAKPPTPEERREWRRRRDIARRAREEEQRHAAQQAEDLIRSCEMREHGYLRLKGFPKLKALVTHDDRLVLPMRDLDTNEVRGVQVIYWDSESREWIKKMTFRMRARDAVFRIGRSRRETILCEGFATGLSIEAALSMTRTDAAVLVCFSAGNMRRIAERLRGRVFVFADHDPGGVSAEAAAGKPYCMAPTVGWDANDWHMAEGLIPVSAAIMEMRRAMR